MTDRGARITLEGAEEIERRLAMLAERTGDLTPIMETIGMRLAVDAEDNFDRESAPDGMPWKPSQRAVREGGKTLQDSRRLRQSLTGAAAVIAGAKSVEVGTNVAYASRHQHGFTGTENVRSHIRRIDKAFGVRLRQPMEVVVAAHDRTVNTPARPFLGISADAEADIIDLIEDDLSHIFEG